MEFFQFRPSSILQDDAASLISNHSIIYISYYILRFKYSRLFHPLLGCARLRAPSSFMLLLSKFNNFRLLHFVVIRKAIPQGPILLLASCSSVIFVETSINAETNCLIPSFPILRLLISKIVFISSIQPLTIYRALGVIKTPRLYSSPPKM